ncbi:MAG: gluconate 2-dehydrogenase subunit 3 family protein, partial [Gemmatimonadaceae bacterium]|nr:gluconate 2-dehydrogenase subunit 3 family protein [Gemmatimonadaceae bacterium]
PGPDAGAGQAPTLDASFLTRVGEVVLPAELGAAGIARVTRAFTQWVAGYRPGAELNHPYGSTEIRVAGPSPAARWRTQLAALDREARSKHQRGFIALTPDQRRALVTAAIADERLTRMPDALGADHVAVALMAWYFATPDATDLCYRARIGRQSCRPLVNAPRMPLPLAGGQPGTAPNAGRDPS